MHLFSNAGANSGAKLLHAFEKSWRNQDDILLLQGGVLDSTSSHGSYKIAHAELLYQDAQSSILRPRQRPPSCFDRERFLHMFLSILYPTLGFLLYHYPVHSVDRPEQS